MDYDKIKKLVFQNIEKSFEHDDTLHSIAKGECTPKRGQLEAIRMIQTRGDNLMKLWQHALGIELPEQTVKTYVITREPLQPSQGADGSNTGQPQV